MNIYTYTSNNPDKPGYYAEVVNSEGEIIFTTSVYKKQETARASAQNIIENEKLYSDYMKWDDWAAIETEKKPISYWVNRKYDD